MNKNIAIKLKKEAEKVAIRFSNKDREGNFNNEDFKIDKIIPLSDHSAVVNYKKSSGKIGCAFFYYIPRGFSEGWKYFFPTEPHIIGMQSFHLIKLNAEQHNYKYNFDDTNN
jgi:hypothetical protein